MKRGYWLFVIVGLAAVSAGSYFALTSIGQNASDVAGEVCLQTVAVPGGWHPGKTSIVKTVRSAMVLSFKVSRTGRFARPMVDCRLHRMMKPGTPGITRIRSCLQ